MRVKITAHIELNLNDKKMQDAGLSIPNITNRFDLGINAVVDEAVGHFADATAVAVDYDYTQHH